MFRESCSTSYTEHNKIKFAFFWIFLRFYIEFTSFSYNTQRGEDSFCERPPGTFQKITDRPLVCTKLPGTTWGFAMWSKGQGAARLAGFRRGRRRGWTGKWGKVVYGSHRLDLSAHLRWNWCRRAATAETGGGGHWRNHSGELVAQPEQQAKGGATGDPRAGRSNTRWRCKRPEG
jgi:hypothetical protein